MPFDTVLPDLDARVAVAIELARKVGRDASNFRRDSGAAALRVENKGLQDFVTVADKQAEDTIRAALNAHFPEDGFIGEESGGADLDTGVWVVDPIDGTTNFMRGFRHWGVSIAFVVGDQVMVGAIYDAAQDAVYSAVRGKGAFKDGKKIGASQVSDPSKAIAIMGHSRRTSFDDYLVMGMGKAPMVMIYEAQFVTQTVRADGSMSDEMVLLYPEPNLYTKHILVTFNANAEKLGEALKNDEELQKLEIEYGFRNSNLAYQQEFWQQHNIQLPQNLINMIEPPSYEVLEGMIQQIETKYN